MYVGWLFHRSGDRSGFIYSRSYLVFLAVAGIPFLIPPVLGWLARRGVLRKIGFALIPAAIMAVILYAVGAEVYYARQQHLFDPFVQVPAPRLPSPRPPKPLGAFRILAIGGSTTGGDRFLTNPTRYPGVLERILREKYPSLDIEVFNAGEGWYTTRHSLINYTTYYQDWAPDLVIEMHAINDLVRSFSPPLLAIGPYDELYTHFYGPSINGARPPSFERTIGYWLAQWTYKPRTFWFSTVLPRTVERDYPIDRYHSITALEGNIRKMIRVVRANGSDMMLMTQASLYHPNMSHREREVLRFPVEFCTTRLNWFQTEIPSPASMDRAMRAYNDRVREIAASEHVVLAEAEPAVAKDLSNFFDDVHYTPVGAATVARAAADAIVQSGIIERRVVGKAAGRDSSR